MHGRPPLTPQERKALKHVLLRGEIPKSRREEVHTSLQKMGYESLLELTSAFFQHALGRIMNDVVGVEAPLSPPRTLRESIEGLLEQLLINDEAPIAAVFSQLEEGAEEPSGQAEAKRPSAPRSPGPKLSEAQLRTLQHALFAPIEENERVQKAGRRSEATLAKLEGLGLLKLLKGQKHHKTGRPGRRSRHGITAQGERLLVQLGLEAIEDKEPAPAEDVSSSAKKSPSKKTSAKKKTSRSRTSLGPLFERALERAEDKAPAQGTQSTADQTKRKSTSKAKSRATTKKRARRSPKRAKADSSAKDESPEHEVPQGAPEKAQAAEKAGRKTVIRRAGKLLDQKKPKADESAPEAVSAPDAQSAPVATADPKAALIEGLERPIRFDEAQSRVGAGYGPVMRELVKAGLYFRHVGHQLWLLTQEGIDRAKAVQGGAELVLQEVSSPNSPAAPAVERPEAPASP